MPNDFIPPVPSLPLDLLPAVCQLLFEMESYGTLAAVQAASSETYIIATPWLYRTLAVNTSSAQRLFESWEETSFRPSSDISIEEISSRAFRAPALTFEQDIQRRRQRDLSFVQTLAFHHLPRNLDTVFGHRYTFETRSLKDNLLPRLRHFIISCQGFDHLCGIERQYRTGLVGHSFIRGILATKTIDQMTINMPNRVAYEGTQAWKDAARTVFDIQGFIRALLLRNGDLRVFVEGATNLPIPCLHGLDMTINFASSDDLRTQWTQLGSVVEEAGCDQPALIDIWDRKTRILQAHNVCAGSSKKQFGNLGRVCVNNVFGGTVLEETEDKHGDEGKEKARDGMVEELHDFLARYQNGQNIVLELRGKAKEDIRPIA